MSNSQSRNLGFSVGFGRFSSISSTQGIGLGREQFSAIEYNQTAPTTNTNDLPILIIFNVKVTFCDLRALVGPPNDNPVIDPLAVLYLYNRLYKAPLSTKTCY